MWVQIQYSSSHRRSPAYVPFAYTLSHTLFLEHIESMGYMLHWTPAFISVHWWYCTEFQFVPSFQVRYELALCASNPVDTVFSGSLLICHAANNFVWNWCNDCSACVWYCCPVHWIAHYVTLTLISTSGIHSVTLIISTAEGGSRPTIGTTFRAGTFQYISGYKNSSQPAIQWPRAKATFMKAVVPLRPFLL